MSEKEVAISPAKVEEESVDNSMEIEEPTTPTTPGGRKRKGDRVSKDGEGEAKKKDVSFDDSALEEETGGRRRTRASARGVVYTPLPKRSRSSSVKGRRGRPKASNPEADQATEEEITDSPAKKTETEESPSKKVKTDDSSSKKIATEKSPAKKRDTAESEPMEEDKKTEATVEEKSESPVKDDASNSSSDIVAKKEEHSPNKPSEVESSSETTNNGTVSSPVKSNSSDAIKSNGNSADSETTSQSPVKTVPLKTTATSPSPNKTTVTTNNGTKAISKDSAPVSEKSQ